METNPSLRHAGDLPLTGAENWKKKLKNENMNLFYLLIIIDEIYLARSRKN